MRRLVHLLASQIVIALITAILVHAGANAATAGFAYLLAILGIAIYTDLATALITSVTATLCDNYFFFEPLHTFAIQEPANWFALISLFLASLIASRLVLRARTQAANAEARQREVEALSAERAHLLAVQEGDALKTSLLRAVSHDLNTPLTAIALQIERLRTIVNDPALDAIAENTGRLRRRIENLLAMARLEARSVMPHPEPAPAADLFRAAREHLPLIVETRAIDVRVDVDCPEVFVDPSLALEILVNLIENAHQASPAGTTIELHAQRCEGDRVRLEVADRGPGMTHDAEPSDTPRRGLGLEIARSLAAASNGEITLANRDGGGTIARIDLPAAHLPAVDEEATA